MAQLQRELVLTRQQRDAAEKDLADCRGQLAATQQGLSESLQESRQILAERYAAVADFHRLSAEKDAFTAEKEELAAARGSAELELQYERRAARANAASAERQVRRCRSFNN